MSKVALRIHFAVPPDDVNVVWHIAEFPCLSEVSRHESEDYGDRKAKPEICGMEEIMVISISASGEPARGDNGIQRLEQRFRLPSGIRMI